MVKTFDALYLLLPDAFLDLLKTENGTIVEDLSLEELYKNASHEQSEFIQRYFTAQWLPLSVGNVESMSSMLDVDYYTVTTMVSVTSVPNSALLFCFVF